MDKSKRSLPSNGPVLSGVAGENDGVSDWIGFLSFRPTKVLEWLLNSPCKITCLYTGNQFGKSDSVNVDYAMRILGVHPNPSKRLLPTDDIRTFRFASQTLPSENTEDEVRNTQYPGFKKRFPNSLIEKDITTRKTVLTVKTPTGESAQVEFVSFSQDTQAMAGVQRRSIWIDEESTKDFYEEQLPRLLAADGDIILTFTPVPGSLGWEFDELYERARIIYRTEAVRARIKERTGEDLPEVQVTESKDDICVIIAATDDNPIYEDLAAKRSELTGEKITAKEYIDELFNMYDDEDVVDARRFGLFRQLSGKIFKSFTPKVHVIDMQKHLPAGVPLEWKHFRGIDYHTSNPWACVWLSVSPTDEIFVWCDYSASPQRMITYDIAHEIAKRSGDYRYLLNMIDPLANSKQVNTNMTTIEDLNTFFRSFRDEDICTGGHWTPWDTKGGRGREELTKRLRNSLKVGKPFNNKVLVGTTGTAHMEILPTIWFSDTCRHTIESMKNWRLDDWSSRDMLSKKDPRETPQAKWSHFPITIECLLKSPIISAARWGSTEGTPKRPKHYYTGAR